MYYFLENVSVTIIYESVAGAMSRYGKEHDKDVWNRCVSIISFHMLGISSENWEGNYKPECLSFGSHGSGTHH